MTMTVDNIFNFNAYSSYVESFAADFLLQNLSLHGLLISKVSEPITRRIRHLNATLLLNRPDIGPSPLHWAIEINNIEALQDLSMHPDVNVNLYKNGHPPLLAAVDRINTEALWVLLPNSRVDVNLLNANGYAPLHMAAIKDENEIEPLKILLSNSRVDVNVKNRDGETPLHWASHYGQIESVKLLLKKPGVDVNAKNREGETPLYRAMCSSKSNVVAVSKLLITSGGIEDIEEGPDNFYRIKDKALDESLNECIQQVKKNKIVKSARK